MFEKIIKLFKNSSIYTLSSLFTKGAGFFLIPIYTNYLSPAEYGIISVLGVIIAISSRIFSVGSQSSIMHFHYSYQNKDRKVFYFNLFLFILILGCLSFFLIHLFGQNIFNNLFSDITYNPFIKYALIIAILNSSIIFFANQIFRAKEESLKYGLNKILLFLISTSLILFFVVYEKKGVLGYIEGKLYGLLILSIILMFFVFKEMTFEFNFNILKRTLKYGIPLIFHFLAHWILGASDKIILENILGSSAVGIYSLGYKFGSVFILFITGINNALMPNFSKAKNKTDLTDLKIMSTYFIGAITFIGLAISLLSKEAIIIMANQRYHDATRIVPFVVLGYFFMGLYYIPMNYLTLIKKRTQIIPILTIIAALSNIVLNLKFIPRYGYIFAAISTTISYFILLILLYFCMLYYNNNFFEFKRVAHLFLSGVLIYFSSIFLISEINIFYSILIKLLIICLLFPVLLYLTNFFNEKEKKYITKYKNILFGG